MTFWDWLTGLNGYGVFFAFVFLLVTIGGTVNHLATQWRLAREAKMRSTDPKRPEILDAYERGLRDAGMGPNAIDTQMGRDPG